VQLVLVAALALPCGDALADDMDVRDLIFVSDTSEQWFIPGCYAMSAIDARTGRALAYSQAEQGIGRLTLTSDASLVLATPGQNVRVAITLERTAGPRNGWTSAMFPVSLEYGAATAISPDDRVVLLPGRALSVQKHSIDVLRQHFLGTPLGEARGVAAADIVFSADPSLAYVVTDHGSVLQLDVTTMSYVGAPVAIVPLDAPRLRRLQNTFAALSPDGQYLVVNTGGPELNVVDVRAGRAWLIEAPGLQTTMGVAFDYVHPQPPRLAVHGYTYVSVYDFRPDELRVIARAQVPPQVMPAPGEAAQFDVYGTLAWLGRGTGVVAAIGSKKEYRILELEPPGELVPRLDFDACTRRDPIGGQRDVVTVNRIGLVPQPTPTATEAPTATSTTTASAPPTVTATATPVPTSTRPARPTPCPTAPPTATPVPVPLYLPLALRERCPTATQHVDVALVIDASTSMRDERSSAGRTRLEAALEAARTFVDTLALPADQAAVVGFNGAAWVEVGLTGRRADVEAALARIPDGVRPQTRIDLGIEAAHRELTGPRRLPTNRAVMIVLTDGQANPEPASTAVRRAAEAKAAGITVFTIGIGAEAQLDVEALRGMASEAGYFYRAPDAEDLAAIYRRVAVELPCPGVELWGRAATGTR